MHVREQYLTYPAGGVLSDRLAEALLLTLTEQGPLAISDPTNYEVRANLMWAANLALNGLIGQGVPQDWTTHHIGHELTALFGIDHARSLAVVLPAVLTARTRQKSEKLTQYGQRVFGVHTGEQAIAKTSAFFESLGIATRLSAYGIGADAIPELVAKLKASRRLRMGERLDITPDEAGKILAYALLGPILRAVDARFQGFAKSDSRLRVGVVRARTAPDAAGRFRRPALRPMS